MHQDILPVMPSTLSQFHIDTFRLSNSFSFHSLSLNPNISLHTPDKADTTRTLTAALKYGLMLKPDNLNGASISWWCKYENIPLKLTKKNRVSQETNLQQISCQL